MNPSGGLPWHFRAWRSSALWSPSCGQLANWLAQLQPKSKQLILLGPSAGWMLPSAWLLRFDYIHAIDLDPLAPRLFARRHGAALKARGVRWQYQSANALSELPRLLQAYPQASVFFDNVLGQLRFHAPKGQDAQQFVEQHLTQIKRHLQGRDWGSVHDLLSGPTQHDAHMQDLRENVCPQHIDLAYSQGLAQSLQAQGTWCDHLTVNVFADHASTTLIPWEFKPQYWHWLQAGWQTPCQ